MAIHPFDSARYLLDAEPVSVYCDEYNPGWSRYRGAAAATAIFRMSGDQRYVYTASWCSPGLETSWNGTWRISAAGGSARWDGDNPPIVEAVADPGGASSVPVDKATEGIAGALAEFVEALRSGRTPRGEVHENLLSLAMVHGAVESAASGRPILIDDVLNRARAEALAVSW
jgi:predicted dehydrogenase